GKTTLTAAITEVLARRSQGRVRRVEVTQLDRERRWYAWRGDVHGDRLGGRGSGFLETRTVTAGEVRYAGERCEFVHLDSPGYRPWLKNAARAQALADALILVVSAPDGVEAQTHEHLLLARGLGIGQLLVFISKCDRVADPEWLDLVEHDVRVLLGRCGFDGDATPIVRGAGLPVCQGETAWDGAIDDLVAAMEREFAPPEPALAGSPLLYVDHVCSQRRGEVGVVVDGRIRRGTIRRGDVLALVGFGATVRVTASSLEIEHRRVESAHAGEFVGVYLTRPGGVLRREEVRTGQALVPVEATAAQRITAEVEWLAPEEGGRPMAPWPGHEGQLLFGTAAVAARLDTVVATKRVCAGARAEVRAELHRPVYVEPGMPFVLRDDHQASIWSKGQVARWGGTCGRGRVLAVEPATR
ncbi:MAG TPA: GTP-binding protein, partial [Nannocystis sp.]